MAALRVRQCVCACARSMVSAAGTTDAAAARAVARSGVRRRGEVVAWAGAPARTWTVGVRSLSVLAESAPAMSAANSAAQAGVADAGSAGGAEYKLVDADVGSDGALDVEESGSDGVTAWFTKRSIQGSTKKLLHLARQITGLSANEAVAQMAFSPKNRGRAVRHVIERAVSNADFYHGWSRDELMVQEAVVGKNLQYPRIRYHARGRSGKAHYRTSQLTVHVRRMTPEEAEIAARRATWKQRDPARAPSPREY